MELLQTGLYQHIKGKHYYVYGTAVHSETQEKMVIYVAESGNNEVWVRPLSMFNEMVETTTGMFPRFSYVGENTLVTSK